MNLKKPISFISFIILISLTSVSCKKELKKSIDKYAINQDSISVQWTGYKTSAKVGVNGEFKNITISNNKQGNTLQEALNGTKFEIPISGLNSGNAERDGKLKKLFFGVMDATLSLSGTLQLEKDGTGYIDILMNSVRHKLPVTYVFDGLNLEINGVMTLDDWKVNSAIESLAKACFEQHKGPDGISKTWKEVLVNAHVLFIKN
jgi:hypothetical protein